MRLWQRLLITLVVAPCLWQLAAAYVASAQGDVAANLAAGALSSLSKLYLAYSLPALVVIVGLLVPAERLLTHFGADLLIVAVAPVLALAVPLLLARFVDNPRLDAAAVYALALAYGLVFGLTIREPTRTSKSQEVRA